MTFANLYEERKETKKETKSLQARTDGEIKA